MKQAAKKKAFTCQQGMLCCCWLKRNYVSQKKSSRIKPEVAWSEIE